MEISNFPPTFLSNFITYKIRPHPLLYPVIFSWRLTNLMPRKATSHEKKRLCLRKSFLSRTQTPLFIVRSQTDLFDDLGLAWQQF